MAVLPVRYRSFDYNSDCKNGRKESTFLKKKRILWKVQILKTLKALNLKYTTQIGSLLKTGTLFNEDLISISFILFDEL